MGTTRVRLVAIAACLVAAIPLHHLAATILDGAPSVPLVNRLASPAAPANQYAATPRTDTSLLCGPRSGRSDGSCALGVATIADPRNGHQSPFETGSHGGGPRARAASDEHERGPPVGTQSSQN